jgi:DNA polymerase I-like protein with 3'-5' exonuclease and polymerase domains
MDGKIIIKDTATAIKYLKQILDNKIEAAYDTETYGVTVGGVAYSALVLNRARLLTFQVSSDSWPSLIFVSNKLGSEFLDFRKIMPLLKEVMESEEVVKIFHNANYDGYVFYNYGIRVRNVYCTMIAGACENEEMSNALKDRAVLVGMLLKKFKTINLENVEDLADYGGDDSEATLRLKKRYDGESKPSIEVLKLGKQRLAVTGKGSKTVGTLQGKRRLFFEQQEMPMFYVSSQMERRGVRLDLKRLAEIDEEIDRTKAKHMKKIYECAGKVFNVASTKQLREVLYGQLGLTCPEDCVTKSGEPSTNARTLFYLNGQHPIIEDLLRFRKLDKLQGTYTNAKSGLPYYADDDGFIHAIANNVGTHTFRFSYSQPNLQTIPSKTDQFGIRKCFIAPDGYKMAVYDYSQIEVRMQALFSGDPIMVDELCKPEGDIYLRTAREFDSPDPVAERKLYKVVVLALQYGMGPWLLADRMTQDGYPMNPHESKAKIDVYFNEVYTGIPEMWYNLFQEHLKRGYVTTLLGRPRKVQGFETHFKLNGKLALNRWERALINNVMQGSAADWIKQAMIRAENSRLAKQVGYHQLLQVHDEVMGIIPEKYEHCFEDIKKLACITPTGVFAPTRDIIVPIRAEGGTGNNWLEAK